ncbi:MAG TPA: NEW3 domain-containing protein [Pirellulales bacterium]|nr:NEW3 domain-containing protein [Pirellulales bacterium]
MSLLPTLVMLSAAWPAPTVSRHPDAVPLYHCGFEQDADEDYDNWPDGWSRRRGPGYPHYVPVRITDDEAAAGKRALRISLDGRAAMAYSPPVAIDPGHDYVLGGQVKTQRLVHDRAFLGIVFLDAQQQPLEAAASEKLRHTQDWTALRIGPVHCGNPDARFAMVAVAIEPEGEQEDLVGSALFDEVWLAQVPRMTLEVPGQHLLYSVGDPIEVICSVSGYRTSPPAVELELRDAFGAPIESRELSLVAQSPIDEEPASEVDKNPGEAAPAAHLPHQVARARWRLPVSEPGFYRLRLTVPGSDGLLEVRDLPLAVVEPVSKPLDGEFGWSLPQGEGELPMATLAQWAGHAGIHWLKFPLWYDEGDRQRVEAVTWLADRLNAQGINLVGLLADPPPETRRALGMTGETTAANLFVQDPRAWYPSLEPVMARMSLKVRWWQLGHDNDTSFVGLPDPVATVAGVKRQLDRIGQNSRVGVGWNWLDEVPHGKQMPWSFLTRSAQPALSSAELEHYPPGDETDSKREWLSLAALDPERYDLTTRVADLVTRMLAAKEMGIGKIFFDNPLVGSAGLVQSDGSPGELFLPWRTTATRLADAHYIGRLSLPGGSDNRLFSRGGETVLVVWNSVPTTETTYLGEAVRATDVWGRSTELPNGDDGQRLEVGPLPIFFTGVNEAIARWRMSVALDRQQVPSVFGAPHTLRIRLQNHFGQPMTGKLRIVAPSGWRVEPEVFDLKLPGDNVFEQAFDITFPSTASCGQQMLRFDFELQADRRYQFSLNRSIDVGLGDVYMELASHLNARGELEVEQRLVNRSKGEVTFRCYLNIPNRRRMRTLVTRLSPGEDVQTYRAAAGEELVGQTLRVRAEEIGGSRRILNYSFLAEP